MSSITVPATSNLAAFLRSAKGFLAGSLVMAAAASAEAPATAQTVSVQPKSTATTGTADSFAQAPTAVDAAFDHLNLTLSWVNTALKQAGDTPENYTKIYLAIATSQKNLVAALESNKAEIPYGKHLDTVTRYASTLTELQRRIDTGFVKAGSLNFSALKYDLAKRAPNIHGSRDLKVRVASLNPGYDAGDLSYEDLVKVWTANPSLLTASEKAQALKSIDSKYPSKKQRDIVKQPLLQAFYKHFAETVAAHRRGSDGGYNEKVLRNDLARVLPVMAEHMDDMIHNLRYMGIEPEIAFSRADRNTGVSIGSLSGKVEILDKPKTNLVALTLNKNVHDFSDIAFPKTAVVAKPAP